MIVGILGLGQVGIAIKKLCRKKYHVVGRDITIDEFKSVATIDILHICIPYSETFEQTVVQTIKEVQPALVIIDSTVLPGTTQAIIKKTTVRIAHCPILGKHPNLAEYQKIFLKPVGTNDESVYKMVQKHFQTIGVRTVKFSSSLDSELAKVLDTTYYAWNILFEKWVWDICTSVGANFAEVYTEFNTIYNQGYRKELPLVLRPVLKHRFGPIGGHCLIPNLIILKHWLNKEKPLLSQWVNLMLEKAEKNS